MTALPSPEVIREAALLVGVCAHPVIARVTDVESGEVRIVPISCGSTREDRCPPCADRGKRLRIQQCREGWHLDTEPEHQPAEPEDQADDGGEDPGEDSDRRVRSTRRRQDAPDLPRMPMEDRTIGRVFTAPDGKTYRPSMFLTVTLPSYGRITPEGVPVDPEGYDYRRAALDALHFPKLVDRFWQNLRRCAGYRVQYFATVEAQRRFAPHLHAALRGTIPRRIVREVRAATYHQVWWPAHDTPVYVEQLPQWSDHASGYLAPTTGAVLPTWDQALDALDTDDEAEPAHVVRFGTKTTSRACSPAAPERTGPSATCASTCPKTSPPRTTTTTQPPPGRPTSTAWPKKSAGCPVRRPAPTGCGSACSPRTRNRAWCRGTANTRRTIGPTSASAAAGSSCPANGQARPSPCTAPTGPRSCGPPSKRPGSTQTTTTSSPSAAPTAAGPGNCSAAPGSMTTPTPPPSRSRSAPASGGAPSTRRPRRQRQLGLGRRRQRP
jgi:Replication initiator protein, pSAM2